jgi:hypothetical protein
MKYQSLAAPLIEGAGRTLVHTLGVASGLGILGLAAQQRGIGVDAGPEDIMLVPIGRLLAVVGIFRK